MSVLNRPCLVLNKGWQAINVVNAARALVLIWNGAAKAVDPRTYQVFTWEDWADLRPEDDQEVVRTVGSSIIIPEVLTLTNFDRLPISSVTFSRRNIYRRDKFTCQYCGAQPGSEELTLDHVVPRAHGGETTWSNCVIACVKCNFTKADRTPSQARMKLKKKPTRPKWSPLYALKTLPIESWAKFISEAYWQTELKG